MILQKRTHLGRIVGVVKVVVIVSLGGMNLWMSVLVRRGELCDFSQVVNQDNSAHIVTVSQ
jgi:hypothetical protein